MNKGLNATLSIDGVRMKPFSVVESDHVADTEDEEGWTEYLVKVYNKGNYNNVFRKWVK